MIRLLRLTPNYCRIKACLIIRLYTSPYHTDAEHLLDRLSKGEQVTVRPDTPNFAPQMIKHLAICGVIGERLEKS